MQGSTQPPDRMWLYDYPELGMRVTEDVTPPVRMSGGGGGLGFPWGENYTFGITQTAANKLKVWKGKLRRFGDQVYSAADTEVTFIGDGDQYIVWRWSTSGLEIVTTPQTNWPAESDSTYIYGVVHKVNLTSGTFTLLESVQTGIINAPIFTVAGA